MCNAKSLDVLWVLRGLSLTYRLADRERGRREMREREGGGLKRGRVNEKEIGEKQNTLN